MLCGGMYNFTLRPRRYKRVAPKMRILSTSDHNDQFYSFGIFFSLFFLFLFCSLPPRYVRLNISGRLGFGVFLQALTCAWCDRPMVWLCLWSHRYRLYLCILWVIQFIATAYLLANRWLPLIEIWFHYGLMPMRMLYIAHTHTHTLSSRIDCVMNLSEPHQWTSAFDTIEFVFLFFFSIGSNN